MKIILKFAAFFLVAVYVFLSCKKDTVQTSPPIARAGANLSLTIPSCAEKITAEMDGSNSTGPDVNIISYTWRRISGPAGYILRDSTLVKARLENLSIGEYAFELIIKDAKNFVARDTMLISVTLKEHDFDMTINGTFNFTDNLEDCYYFPCSYYDQTEIQGKGTFLPFGELIFYNSEYADTASLSYKGYSHISLYRGNYSTFFISGTSSVSLKKIIQQGGGPFNGIFTVSYSSAQKCNYTHSPLNISGTLDLATRKVTLSIKGKTSF